jgi:hypothetical protein
MKKKLINFFAWFVGIFAVIGGFIWVMWKFKMQNKDGGYISDPDWKNINKELKDLLIKQKADETVKSFKDMFGG